MIKKVLIQTGDIIENHERVLSCCVQLKYLGFNPVVLLYNDNGSFFEQFSIDIVRLADNYPSSLHQSETSDSTYDDVCFFERLRSDELPNSFSKAHINRVMYACSKIIKTNQIDLLFVWNGHTGAVANCLRVIKETSGMPGGYMERGLLKNSVFFDTKGVNGSSLLAIGSQELGQPKTNISDILNKEFRFSSETLKDNFMGEKSKVIFIPLQVQGDTNIILHSEHIKLMRNLVLEGIKLAERLGNEWKVIVRPHPEEDSSVELNIPNDSNVVIRGDTQLNDEILNSSVVLTINSTVGLEASILGRYVIACGKGIYTAENFVRSLPALKSDHFDLKEDVELFYRDFDKHFASLERYLMHLISRFHFIPRRYKALYAQSVISELIRENCKDCAIQNADTVCDIQVKHAFDALSSMTANANPFCIDVFINANDKVNVTYRKYDVPVDKNFIEKRVKFYTGHEELNMKLNPAPENQIRSDIAIFPTDYSGEELKHYLIVFDEKMNLHPSVIRENSVIIKRFKFDMLQQKFLRYWGLSPIIQKLSNRKIGTVTLKRRLARLRRKYIG
jgi:hypothetical protein